jgi:imidazolonepropionase-like amidohydrolase
LTPGAARSCLLAGALLLSAGFADAGGSPDIVIRDVTLLDGTGSAPRPGVSVFVSGERIVAVKPGPAPVPAGAAVVEGAGRYLIPGIIDTHVHVQGGRVARAGGEGTVVDRQLAVRTLQAYLYSGVTSIFDSGNNPDFIFGLRAEERGGTLVAPRIFATGANITAPQGYGDNAFSIKVANLEADRPLLEAHFDRKPDLQKILYDRLGTFGSPAAAVLSQENLQGIIALAHRRGIPTTVHTTTEWDSLAALGAGIDAFAHPVRAAVTPAFARTLAERRVPVSTTLAVFGHIARVAEEPEFLDAPLFRATIDPAELSFLRSVERQRYIASGMSAQFKAMNPHIARTVKRLHDAGVPLALGTDRTLGASVHMELELLAQAGIPLADILRIATLNGALYLNRERDLGSIEPGKLADMVLLRSDPTRDVAAYQAIEAVFKGGRRIDLDALDLPVNYARPTP